MNRSIKHTLAASALLATLAMALADRSHSGPMHKGPWAGLQHAAATGKTDCRTDHAVERQPKRRRTASRRNEIRHGKDPARCSMSRSNNRSSICRSSAIPWKRSARRRGLCTKKSAMSG